MQYPIRHKMVRRDLGHVIGFTHRRQGQRSAIAETNVIDNQAGFFSLYLVGWVRESTRSFTLAS
jgi:hypothetical protein